MTTYPQYTFLALRYTYTATDRDPSPHWMHAGFAFR